MIFPDFPLTFPVCSKFPDFSLTGKCLPIFPVFFSPSGNPARVCFLWVGSGWGRAVGLMQKIKCKKKRKNANGGGGDLLPGGGLLPGAVCSWGGSWMDIPACTEADPRPVNRITHTCKNITLAHLRCGR